jgi:ABC-2 type transport system ATP-binding protein
MDVLEMIKSIKGVTLLEGKCSGTKARIKVPESNVALPLILEGFWNRKVAVLNVAVKKPSLDQAFMEYTGRELRDEDKGNGGKPGVPAAKKGRFGRRR